MKLQEKAFYAIEVLNEDQRLEQEFKKEFPNNTLTQLWDALKWGLLSEEHQDKLVRLVPPVFEISGKLFLYGEEKGRYDFIGNSMDYGSVVELFDMTTEMKEGHTYSFYVSSVDYFELACAKDAVDVKLFLNSL